MSYNFLDFLPLILFIGTFIILLSGFPVAFVLSGFSIAFAFVAAQFGWFDWGLMFSLGGRIVNLMTNETLVAIPLFIFMGTVLERSKIAEDLLITMGHLFGSMPGGLGISVIIVGMLLAASTGIVGATVVTMGLISLPAMQRAKYNPRLSSGIICASGTLAQLIPPSTVLILLGITLQNANTQANLQIGNFSFDIVSISDLFVGSILPGILLVGCYIAWILFRAVVKPTDCPALIMDNIDRDSLPRRVFVTMFPPILLIIVVLGSILSGIATATESAALGALGACALALLRKRFNTKMLYDVSRSTLFISNMIFGILIGATIFTLVFRGFGGDEQVERLIHSLPGGAFGATIFVLAVMFFLGFLLDTFEIIFIIVPIFAPVLIALGVDPLWLGVAMAIVLQTSYLTPPLGFALFYLQGVAPDLKGRDIYLGVIPFIAIQLLAVIIIWLFPQMVTGLPKLLF